MNSDAHDFDHQGRPTDWASFRFPPRPPRRAHDNLADAQPTPAPLWAQPPSQITQWHFDTEHLFIIHPVMRKKIDLRRVNTKRRLVQLLDFATAQSSPSDIAALIKTIDKAFRLSFEMSAYEWLAGGPEKWEWPEIDFDTLDHRMNDQPSSDTDHPSPSA